MIALRADTGSFLESGTACAGSLDERLLTLIYASGGRPSATWSDALPLDDGPCRRIVIKTFLATQQHSATKGHEHMSASVSNRTISRMTHARRSSFYESKPLVRLETGASTHRRRRHRFCRSMRCWGSGGGAVTLRLAAVDTTCSYGSVAVIVI